MSSSDGHEPLSNSMRRQVRLLARPVDSHLLEALMYVLIEKGVLTRNDALSVVETVAEVARGERETADDDGARAKGELKLLRRLYASFEALEDRPEVVALDSANVHRLRPPLHGDRPSFPRDD